MPSEGLTGLFVVQARRAEILAEQGRRDVIDALRRHEIGLHGRDHHPVNPEIVEGLGWRAGVAALRPIERAELALLGRVFDVAPVCLSEHRGHAAPQAFALAAELGLPYLFGFPSAPPRHSVSWYAGALNVPFDSPAPEFLGFFPAVFDDALPDDAAFAALLGRLRAHVARALAAGLPLLVVFACHPERLYYAGPLERWQYGNGRNHGRAAVPPGVESRRAPGEVRRALANFRALVRFVRDAPGVEPITVADLVRRYSGGGGDVAVTRAELTEAATRALADRQIAPGGECSPAETLLGFADSLVRVAAGGPPPERIARRAALGPTEPPPLAPEAPHLGAADLVDLAGRLLAAAAETGHLPAALPAAGRVVGLGSAVRRAGRCVPGGGARRGADGRPAHRARQLAALPGAGGAAGRARAPVHRGPADPTRPLHRGRRAAHAATDLDAQASPARALSAARRSPRRGQGGCW